MEVPCLPRRRAGALLALVALAASAVPAASQTRPAGQSSLLARDERLQGRLTVPAGNYSTGALFAAIYRATRVRPYAEELELQRATLEAGCKGVSAAALMDAVSALWLARWRKEPRRRYQLLPSQQELQVYLPRNRFQRDRAPAVRRFISQLSQLPRNDRLLLLSGRSVPTGLLPQEMQRSLHTMVESIDREQTALQGYTNPFPLGSLSRSSLRIEARQRRELNTYFLTLFLRDWGSMGWLISDYEDPAAARGSAAGATLHVPEKFEVAPEEARELPALQKQVTLTAKQATLPALLRSLHQRYGVPFVCDAEQWMKERADVAIEGRPLAEALDRLTEIFPGTEWEYRKLGFLIVRSPGNPSNSRRRTPAGAASPAPAHPD
jgi:hypothetical protein